MNMEAGGGGIYTLLKLNMLVSLIQYNNLVSQINLFCFIIHYRATRHMYVCVTGAK